MLEQRLCLNQVFVIRRGCTHLGEGVAAVPSGGMESFVAAKARPGKTPLASVGSGRGILNRGTRCDMRSKGMGVAIEGGTLKVIETNFLRGTSMKGLTVSSRWDFGCLNG